MEPSEAGDYSGGLVRAGVVLHRAGAERVESSVDSLVLARENEGIDTTFYPLGSCTMKHNPRANEAAAVVPGFAGLHPLQPEAQVQGALRVMHELQGFLAEVSGLPYVSLQPLAGAQGELTSILMVKRFFDDAGDDGRTAVLVPSTAHGTNPATASMAGFESKEVGLDEHG